MRRRMKGGAALIIVGAAALGIAIHHSVATASGPHARNREAQRGLTLAAGMSCSAASSPLALVGRVAPGHSTAELARAGYAARPAILHKAGDQTAIDSDLVTIRPASGRGFADPAALAKNPALSSVGIVYQQSTDPSLRSCDHRLIDRPQAQELIHAATVAMLAKGYLTQAEMNAGSTIYLVSDDPLTPGHEFVSVVLAKTFYRGSQPTPSSGMPPDALTPIVADVNRTARSVSDVGFGNWYAAQ